MTTLPPILNAPQVGMLIREDPHVEAFLIIGPGRHHGCVTVWYDEDHQAGSFELVPRCRVRWPKAPEDSWVPVFAEKVEPVREWTKFVQKELAPDFLTNLNWVSSQAEAEAQEVPPGYIRLAIACRERQPDGTWRAVSDNPVQRIMASQKDAPAEEMTTNQDPIGGCYDRR